MEEETPGKKTKERHRSSMKKANEKEKFKKVREIKVVNTAGKSN